MKYLSLSLFLILSLALLSLGGCGYKESTVIPDAKAYLWFTGNTKGVTATIDGQDPINLTTTFTTDATGQKMTKKSETHYEINPGKHTITLFRDNAIILERIVLIGNHMTKEIEIP